MKRETGKVTSCFIWRATVRGALRGALTIFRLTSMIQRWFQFFFRKINGIHIFLEFFGIVLCY